ncbi:MAG TPA: hypothetical protein VMI31_17160 [Fimbriimonadaceae bacterium]|nr:hypothetical protein [Fimbriimonadaceae bacterium]
MARISLTTISDASPTNPQEAAAQTQGLKTALSRVKGLQVVTDSEAAEPGTKSGPGSVLAFTMELVTSPHVVAAVGVVLFEWLKHNMGRSVQLVVEGEKIVIESGSHKRVEELVHVLEEKLKGRA